MSSPVTVAGPPATAARRRVRLAVVLATCVAVVGSALPAGAGWSARGSGGAAARAVVVAAPAALTAQASGHDVALTWSPGSGTDYEVRSASAPGGSCAGVTPSATGTATGTGWTDVGRYTPQGTAVCYQVVTRAVAWRSVTGNPTAVVRVGFVATAVTLRNAGNLAGCSGSGTGESGVAGGLDCGDQIVVTFNQPVSATSGPAAGETVCASGETAAIVLASPETFGGCAAGSLGRVGAVLVPAGVTNNARHAATYAWSTDRRTLTITVGVRVAGNKAPLLNGSPTLFAPTTDATRLRSSTGDFHVCDTDAGGGACRPTVTGSV